MQLTNELIKTLNETLESTRTPEVPGAAAAILSPAGNWFGASGVSNVAENTPIQPGDRFEAGSITKTFIATTILQLAEENQLSLDDPLTQWLPPALTNFVPNAAEITVKQLLNHTSGIADALDGLFAQAATNPTLFLQDWQPVELLGFLEGVEPLFEPGESWQYSNTNYILAGSLIEAVTGNNYASEIRDRILTPLNLNNTFFAEKEEIPGGYIKGYWDFDANGTLDDLSVTNLSWASSAGSLISNTEDLAAFFAGLFKGSLLQPESLAKMLDTIPVESASYDTYGLGIGTLESPDRFWYVHRGQTLGFRSNLWYSPNEDITYVELINGRSTDNIVGDLLPAFRKGLENSNPPTSVEFDIIGTDSADTLVGTATNNAIDGKAGDDTLAGGLGDDIILGGDGNDVLRGDANSRSPQNEVGGNDIIFGGAGSDRIGGKAGNDQLIGDAGDDSIWGDAGDDNIMGGTGNDILVGGSGSDLFVFGSGDGTDTLTDFEVGADRIGLIEGDLVFADLTITQSGNNTLLGVTSSGETLAVLNSVQASSLTESSFAIVPDVSNPEEALALI